MALLKKRLKTYETEFPNIEKSIIDPESEQIAKILPDDLYKEVAKIIGLDVNVKEKIYTAKRKNYRRLYKGIKNLSKALHGVTVEKDTTDEYYSDSSVEPPSPRIKPDDPNTNVYFDFFNKTEREQVTWKSNYLPPETEMEKGLIRRADDLTNKICSEFCTYMRNLGGYDSPLFQEETVKGLFQIEFNEDIVHSLEVCPKEITLDPHKLQKIEIKDKGVTFPNIDRRKIINKQEKWRTLDHLPKNTITMENVWGDITGLKCVQDYCQWIIEHPSSKQPRFLKNSGMIRRENLKKIRHSHKYDETNILPKIDIDKQLSKTTERKMSPPSHSLKIRSSYTTYH